MQTINPGIFKAYDIRGIYPTDLDEDLAKRIGQAYATLITQELKRTDLKIVVSRDMRLSSPSVHDALVAGITESGLNVIDIGLASTPTFYFAVGYLKADGGVQISASHNPSEYNGFKMVRAKAVPVSGENGIYTIRDMVISGQLMEKAAVPGKVETFEGMEDIVVAEFLKDIEVNQIKPLTVVFDAANSMAAPYAKALFKKLPAKLIKVNFELDGTFPSHEADPLKDENLELVKQKVIENNADFGIATDGDGDRIFFITEKGDTVAPEILRGILAQIVLKKFPEAPIGFDIRPGKITKDMIEEAGGKPFITRVGHSLIKEKMLEMDAPFSGESSGHFFYKTPYGSFDSPVKVIVDFVVWLSQHDQPLSQLIKPLQRYFHSGEINSDVPDTEAKLKAIADKYKAANNVSLLDGVTVEYDTYWFNVRPSNTEPKLRLNLEAVDQATMEQKRDEILSFIRS